ncbi:class I SAM-dependent methyltransferase [Pseudonocardia sp. CA-107938]|uniref:class I SAM-dependent methyltransferase n=1 Tax=Pseudonocardia sp. CA-107938 TaxID=3240021 RepID=UPI003D8FEA64
MAPPVLGDAFGTALRQCHAAGGATGSAVVVVERDDGWVSVADVAPYLSGPDDWSAIEREMCERATGRVLDIGCGAGRHVLALQARGVDALGVDTSAGALAVCAERSAPATAADVDALPAHLGRFDTFLMLGWNLGFLSDQRRAAAVLARLAQLANPGARVIGTGADPHLVEDEEHRAALEANRRRGRLPGQMRMRIRFDRLATPFFDYLYCSPAELDALVGESPWRLSDVVPDEETGTYGAVLTLAG